MPCFGSIAQELILAVWPLYPHTVYSGRGILLVLGQPSSLLDNLLGPTFYTVFHSIITSTWPDWFSDSKTLLTYYSKQEEGRTNILLVQVV